MSCSLLKVSLVLLLAVYSKCRPFFNEYDNPAVAEKYSQFSCFKLHSCTSGPPKVCGYDSWDRELAEFEDKCTLYKINCKQKRMFHQVEMSHCLMKKDFQSNNRTKWIYEQSQKDWIHVDNPVLRAPTEATQQNGTEPLEYPESNPTNLKKAVPLVHLVKHK